MNRVTPSLPLRPLFLALALLLHGPAARAEELVSDLERDVTPHSGMPCPSPESYSLTRPDPDGTPTTVGAAIFFQDIAQLSDIDQTLDADVVVMSRWRDARLADPSRGEHSADCPLPEGKLWMPALEPENLRSRQSFYAPRFTVDAKGVVTVGRRLWVKIAHPLDFREFPFDRHQWMITIWPVFSRSDEVVFHPLKQWVGKNEHLSI